MSTRLTFIIIGVMMGMFVVVGVVALSMCSQQFQAEELKVLDLRMTTERDMPIVVGKAINDTESPVQSPRAEVEWYGIGGILLGTSTQTFSGILEPGDVWQFVVKGQGVSAAQVVKYELKVTY